ncbi:MAG: GFA family protein [Defluviicoccus sp.]
MATHRGSCFCGAVGIEVTDEPEEIGYCHCSSCRSYSGGPISAFTLWKAEKVRITRGEISLGGFNKTGLSNRRFCTECGGHVMTEHPTLGYTDVYAAILPTLPFKPTVHLNYAETVLPITDGLPKLRDFPSHAGGSGDLIPE